MKNGNGKILEFEVDVLNYKNIENIKIISNNIEKLRKQNEIISNDINKKIDYLNCILDNNINLLKELNNNNSEKIGFNKLENENNFENLNNSEKISCLTNFNS